MSKIRKTKKAGKRRAKVSAPKEKEAYYRTVAAPEGYLGSVMIAGDSIEVYRVKDLHAPDGDKVDGLYHPAMEKIELEAHLGPKGEKQVFIHELWHALRHKYELPMGSDAEESLAGPIGNGFASALARWLPSRHLRPWGDK